MKQIKDMLSLAGQRTTITVSEFRANPGEVLKQAEMGMYFSITKNGKPIAALTHPADFDWGALQKLRKASK